LSQLEIVWRELEERSPTTSFFNSWAWIGCWLEALPPQFERRLLKATCDGVVVGLGVLVRSTRKCAGVPFCTAWHLHAAGDPVYDGAMVEHNDFLIDAAHGDVLRSAMIMWWARSVGISQELHLPGLEGQGFAPVVSGKLIRHDEARISYAIALEPVRLHKLDFTPLVSSHSRRFIRRSIKEYQTLGPIRVTVAAEISQAMEFFERMVALHQERWTMLGEDGSFKSEFRVRLHRAVIERYLASGQVQLLQVQAGDRDIGYLYSFSRGNRLYVYQSGFDYTVLEKHGRPGLVTHTFAVQHNAALGYDVYDLMAGESQYKSTLATVHETLTWSVWRKPAIRFAVERYMRSKVRSFRSWRTPQCGRVDQTGVELATKDV
jgi:CelD/BcsL family acetyltransferase involved in cellulose biosynthesis